ncbi:MAG: prolyl oligopeptidase family serine peptidase [Desulfobacula sp.]|nr:prolyl oligopeptidase family serine peptidase [Desulfobacula sp.]
MKNSHIFFAVASSFLLGALLSIVFFPVLQSKFIDYFQYFSDTRKTAWPKDFSIVEIRSTIDNTIQHAYFYDSKSSEKKPLLISLHTWSGDYRQNDPLSQMAKANEWNYIHPDFRGLNQSPDGCLSNKAIADIDDAIQYALDHCSVNKDHIFVTGVSGGGYASLGVFLKTRHKIRAFLAWSPISDLDAWYWQSKFRKARFHDDILRCISTGASYDKKSALERSPLYYELPEKQKSRLEIYHGINDGYTGSVPITHSILFFNRMVSFYETQNNLINQKDMNDLLSRGIPLENVSNKIDGRDVLYRKEAANISITIFDGGHEMLAEYCFFRMKEMIDNQHFDNGDAFE